jgi:hypothetical protein
VGKASSYEISEEDFVKDDASSSGRGNDFASGEDRAEDFVKDSDDGGES